MSPPGGSELPTLDERSRLRRYETMARIRRFEPRTADLYRDGEISGFVHLSVGQEGVAVGVCDALDADDVITSTHRGHAHVLAKGLPTLGMFAELMGRATGTCGGFGGSMHIADPSVGIFGANGIVGAGLPIAAGAGFSIGYRKQNRVVVAFFGDGAVATGAFHEAANLISLWRLPVILLCENNGYSEFSRTVDPQPISLQSRAAGYGLRYASVDGNDVEAVYATATELVRGVRTGAGPVLLEALTVRIRGHYEGDPQRYRNEYDDAGPVRDPIARARDVLLHGGVAASKLDELEGRIELEIEDTIEQARAAPWPTVERMLAIGDVGKIVSRVVAPAIEQAVADEDPIRGSQAVRRALDDCLGEDPATFVAGIDVGAGGNVFGLTRGLSEKYPGRVFDTPISEAAIVGLAVGAAFGRPEAHRRAHVS